MASMLSMHNDLFGITFKGSKTAVNYTDRSTVKLDDDGVLAYKIPYTQHYDYYPIFMARYSLGNLELFLETGEQRYEQVFMTQVKWLFHNLTIKKNYAFWEHRYTLPYYDFTLPWVHGLGQALGMTALLKAYQLTKKKPYLKAAEQVLHSFDVDVSHGGVQYVDEAGDVWFEEYAVLPPPHVLNGFITILFGLHEFHRITQNENAKQLWEKGLTTVTKHIDEFDTGYWSLYELLRGIPATKNYHRMHIWQLEVLHQLTGKDIFQIYAKRWKAYAMKQANNTHAQLKRGLVHLQRYGILGSIQRYRQRKQWEKND
jgi:heparosan-N-sulfate-glucuronate 5-epimerase